MALQVKFFMTDGGNEPVRNWLKSLEKEDKKTIGENIKTVQLGWPVGEPWVKHVEKGLWEVRSGLNNRIARVIFTIRGDIMYLLHGFIKKTEKTAKHDLDLARKRFKQI